MNKLKLVTRFFAIVVVSFLVSCSGGENKKKSTEQTKSAVVEAVPVEINDEAKALLAYLEEMGDYVNTRNFPSLIKAESVFEELNNNNLVIDMRKSDLYKKGHIKGAVNVEISGLTEYFANEIKPFEYDKIILACNSGQSSSYATSLLRLMGYGNVYSLRWGMSGWSSKIDNKWLANCSSAYSTQLETSDHEKAVPADFPVMNTGKTTGAEIFDERINGIFNEYTVATITADSVFAHPEKYYVINYDRKDKYEAGHVPGAIRYKPGGTLGIVTEMQTIPADKEVVVYCGTSHNSAFVTAYLRLFGYNAKTLRYGNNGFMHDKMVAEKAKLSWLPFTEADVQDFPIAK